MHNRYEQNADGLQAYIQDLLDRYAKKRTQIQLKNLNVAHKMRVTHSGLVKLQQELNTGEVLSCKRGITRSVYKLKIKDS